MFDIYDIILKAKSARATDIHLSVNNPPIIRVDGYLLRMQGYPAFTVNDLNSIIEHLLGDSDIENRNKETDFSFGFEDVRIRANLYYERGNPALALRIITKKIRTFEELGIPIVLKDFCDKDSGLVIVTGPTGSGKSTTLAAMIDYINSKYAYHIITIEDPIEYVFENKNSLIHQRELGRDTQSFSDGLKYALRQDPDIILVGEMRDLETIALALTAAETGHLVLATLHTNSAATAPERIVDVFPAHQQKQISLQLANTLIGVVFQRLVPKKGTGLVPVVEVLVANMAVKNLIREGKIHQIESIMQTAQKQGNVLFDDALLKAYFSNIISKETVVDFAREPEEVAKKIGWTGI
ncbi:MAG TPA: type IV pilus twitching motility protein PilT [Fervidobacterium sp.]|nr:type IV pilus twitching motility protein PilT [Fervidobacterium sp.]HOL03241.1 type IV pilus twitching motility protein PilT [Fervidobacterium sp.]HPC79093.1 type IV pilus twitching motility protein PilT [Fervidobacterium sp.]HQG01348.1 type IV pilus twitching motility protein PilT [Fervidobacterium sp.]HRB91297.1 type IV pilus twitching motility protein PilT [Fervidobacterium sp.]